MNEQAKMLLSSPNVVCPNCGHKFFKEVYALKRISAILSPTGEEENMPIPLYACDKCGTIPDEYTKKRNYKLIVGEVTAEEAEKENAKEAIKSSIIMP